MQFLTLEIPLHIGLLVSNYIKSNILGKLIGNLFWANIFWASLGAIGLVLSIIWNIVDYKYEGLANLPSKQTVDADNDNGGENDEDEEEEEGDYPDTPRD